MRITAYVFKRNGGGGWGSSGFGPQGPYLLADLTGGCKSAGEIGLGHRRLLNLGTVSRMFQ